MEFTETETAITESQLQQFEASYQLALPQDYREHILEFNGGLNEFSYYLYEDEEYFVASFLPINNGELTANMLLDTLRDVDDDRFPNYLYPFADDAFGNYYCINLQNNSVVLWSHDTDDELELLASSFSDFLNNLVEEGEEYEF